MANKITELLDKVAEILNSTVNANDEYDVIRQILPRTKKQERRRPQLFVSLSALETTDYSRGDLYLTYTVSVALVYDAAKENLQEDALGVINDVVETLTSSQFNIFQTPSGYSFSYMPTYSLDPVFDPDTLNDEGTIVSVSNFKYCFLKDR